MAGQKSGNKLHEKHFFTGLSCDFLVFGAGVCLHIAQKPCLLKCAPLYPGTPDFLFIRKSLDMCEVLVTLAVFGG